MKTIKKTVLLLMTVFSVGTIKAQEEIVVEVVEKKKFQIHGSVDVYYQTDITAADNVAQSFGTSFANELGFALGMANVIVSYDGEKTGVVADLAFGPRGDAAVGGYNINQLYAYWNVSEATTFTIGRFNTYLGYEVISPVGNFNYSTSYLFSSGPFSHVGLKADIALSEDFSLMLAVMNVTDVNSNIAGSYSGGLQLGYKGQYLNFYYDNGEALGFEVDYTGGFDVTDSFYLGLNGAFADNDGEGFYGGAVYPQFSTSDSFTIGLRGEYFGLTSEDVSNEASVFAATLTGSYAVESFTIKPELRLDTWGESEPYIGSDGMPTDLMSTFLVAAMYSF